MVCSTTTLFEVSAESVQNREPGASKTAAGEVPLVKQFYYYASSFSKKSVTQNPGKNWEDDSNE